MSGVTYLARLADPLYGGILAAAPIITILAFLFRCSNEVQQPMQPLVLGSFYFTIPSLLFLLGFWFLMGQFGFFLGFGGASGIRGRAICVMHRLVMGG